MFGVSLPEFIVLGTVALLVLGPERLPGMLRTMGTWIAKLRRLTTEVRHQSGIDDVLRAEGFDGGLNELRSMMRGGGGMAASHTPIHRPQPVVEHFVPDRSREYPTEGPDAYGALPEDLVPGAVPTAPIAISAPAELEATAAAPSGLAEEADAHAAVALPGANPTKPTPPPEANG